MAVLSKNEVVSVIIHGVFWIEVLSVMIQVASGVNKFSLLAIPFFVLAGAIMAEGGMARRLVAFAGVLVGFIRGGLSLVNILVTMVLKVAF